MQIDIRPLFQCQVLVIREDPHLDLKHRYYHKMVDLYNKWDAREAQCTPSRACMLTAAGKTDEGQNEDETTYQASQ